MKLSCLYCDCTLNGFSVKRYDLTENKGVKNKLQVW